MLMENVERIFMVIAPYLVIFLALLGILLIIHAFLIFISMFMHETCPECGTKNEFHNGFCKKCGAPLTNERCCPKCGKSNPKDAEFCVHCGEKIK